MSNSFDYRMTGATADQVCVAHACFSALWDSKKGDIEYINHHCPTNLGYDVLKTYFHMLMSALDNSKFTFDATKKGMIEFWLDSKDMPWGKMAVYLTMFRYPEEFAVVVSNLSKFHGQSEEKVFMEFQREAYGAGNSNHAINSPYAMPAFKAISLEEFKQRLASPKYSGPFAHFHTK